MDIQLIGKILIRGLGVQKNCYSTHFLGVFPIELAVLMMRLPYIPKVIFEKKGLAIQTVFKNIDTFLANLSSTSLRLQAQSERRLSVKCINILDLHFMRQFLFIFYIKQSIPLYFTYAEGCSSSENPFRVISFDCGFSVPYFSDLSDISYAAFSILLQFPYRSWDLWAFHPLS